jgi:hypothetical protein
MRSLQFLDEEICRPPPDVGQLNNATGKLHVRDAEYGANAWRGEMYEQTIASVAVAHRGRTFLETAHEGCKGGWTLPGPRHPNNVNGFGETDGETDMVRGQPGMDTRA